MDAEVTPGGGPSEVDEPSDGVAPDDRDHQIERALDSVPGVASARVLREGPATRLRVRLQPGQDREPVARALAATLVERFDIVVDPAAIRVVTGPSPAYSVTTTRSGASRSPLVARRASITRVEISHTDEHVQVAIALTRDDQRVVGTARTRPGDDRVLDAVAEATAAALRQLTLRPVGLEALEVFPEPPDAPTRVSVVVRLQAGRGDEDLLGASVVRGDLQDAVVRATLDAVNRRVEPLLLEDR
jgi:hypothetical protein